MSSNMGQLVCFFWLIYALVNRYGQLKGIDGDKVYDMRKCKHYSNDGDGEEGYPFY